MDCELVFIWNDEIIEHLTQHDVSTAEFEYVVCNPWGSGTSRSSGRPLAKGYTETGRWLVCIYEIEDDDITVIPWTAYEP